MNSQLLIFEGCDSHKGSDFVKLNKNYSLEYIIQYCKDNNCYGFVKVGKGQYYIRKQKYSYNDLINDRKDYSYKYNNIKLYVIIY